MSGGWQDAESHNVGEKMPNRDISGKRLLRALDHLAAADDDLARAVRLVGAPPPRRRPPGFASLLWIIVGQQLSTASANAIWGRLGDSADAVTPQGFLRLSDERLRAVGFSRPKMVYGRDLAAAVVDGRLDIEALSRLSDDEAIAALTALRGLGRWSAEVYLLFCLCRPDVLPADDLALLTAAQRVKRLAARPTARTLRQIAEPWRPWRSVAARLLWHYYRRAPAAD
jgi:DNA-3-methyladenine glycosylase II